MAMLNKILNGVVAFLAIVALLASGLLFMRRNEFRERADKLAQAVSAMVKDLDNGSGINAAAKVTFKPRDPSSGTPESGSLGWQEFHDNGSGSLDGPLSSATGLAKKVANQRNTMAEFVAGSVATFKTEASLPGAPAEEDVAASVSALKNVNQFTDAMAQFQQDFMQSGKAMGAAVDAMYSAASEMDIATTRRDFATALIGNPDQAAAQFAQGFSALTTRCTDYADALVNLVNRVDSFAWNTDPLNLSNPKSYGPALASLVNEFSELNDQFVALQDVEYRLRDAEEIIEQRDRQVASLQENLAAVEDSYTQLEKIVQSYGLTTEGDVPMDMNLEGSVVEVNDNWKFVIIDLGRGRVREGLDMIIARGEELVGKVKISRVLKEVCIGEIQPVLTETDGEIQPVLNGSDVKVGDRVIFPRI